MRIAHHALAAAATLMLLTAPLFAQEKLDAEPKNPPSILKLQVTIAEQQGEKKVASLPYVFFLRTGENPAKGFTPWTKVRVGSRIPVEVGKDGALQYLDIGTNIDSRAFSFPEGRFDISLNLERSWLEGEAATGAERTMQAPIPSSPTLSKEPIVRQFKTELSLTIRDGQTVQSILAADPLSGGVFTVTVALNVVK